MFREGSSQFSLRRVRQSDPPSFGRRHPYRSNASNGCTASYAAHRRGASHHSKPLRLKIISCAIRVDHQSEVCRRTSGKGCKARHLRIREPESSDMFTARFRAVNHALRGNQRVLTLSKKMARPVTRRQAPLTMVQSKFQTCQEDE